MVLLYTVFTSVLDGGLKQAIATEAQRVTRSGGLILVYDFKATRNSTRIRGVPPSEIKTLFADARVQFQAVTLAMPIAWRLAPLSWLFCALLEKVPWLKTHYLAIIHP